MTERQERALSFGSIAEDYDRLRPAPAVDAVSWLVPGGCGVAVDVAAGTGLLTRALASRVPQVIAVEPDARMRAVLSSRSPEVRVLDGRGEAIPLPDASADAVLVSSAWHWMDPDRALPEIARVLRPGGRFGVIWTSRDRRVEWLRELGDVARGGRSRRDQRGAGWPGHHVVQLPQGSPFGREERAEFTFERVMSVDDVVALLATYSGLITASADERAAHLQRARAVLVARFPGESHLAVPMRSSCWRADRIA